MELPHFDSSDVRRAFNQLYDSLVGGVPDFITGQLARLEAYSAGNAENPTSLRFKKIVDHVNFTGYRARILGLLSSLNDDLTEFERVDIGEVDEKLRHHRITSRVVCPVEWETLREKTRRAVIHGGSGIVSRLESLTNYLADEEATLLKEGEYCPTLNSVAAAFNDKHSTTADYASRMRKAFQYS